MKKTNPCDGCGYMRKSGGQSTCAYYTITKQRRPCPPGEGCTVRLDQRAQQRAAQHNRDERVKLAYGRYTKPQQKQ